MEDKHDKETGAHFKHEQLFLKLNKAIKDRFIGLLKQGAGGQCHSQNTDIITTAKLKLKRGGQIRHGSVIHGDKKDC